MIIVKIMFGLGNQMFQYAAAKSLAISLGKELYLDTSFYEIYKERELNILQFPNICDGRINLAHSNEKKLVPLQHLIKSVNGTSKHVVIEKYHELPQHFNIYKSLPGLEKDIILLQGFFQNERYFKKHENEIKRYFFKTLPMTHTALAEKIEQSESVSIHLRRGDYITDIKARNFYRECSLDYYLKCLKFLQKKTSTKLSLFFFSDDMDWVKKSFPINSTWDITYVNNCDQDPTTDMLLMSKCKHNVIANSTYSWWGAWLNNNKRKIICAPKTWFNQHPTGSLLPKNWYSF